MRDDFATINFSIDDQSGTCIAVGLSKQAALDAAQKFANEKGESVEVYPERGAPSDTEPHPDTIVVRPRV